MDYAVLISGLGRCGTTILYKSFKELTLGWFIFEVSNDRLAHEYKDLGAEGFYDHWLNYPRIQWQVNNVYKTHDFAPRYLHNVKVAFLFGDPRNIVLSAHHSEGFELALHYKHMHADFSTKEQYSQKDTLRLEENFDSWYKQQTFPLITVRYETMHQNISEIEAFFDCRIELPPFQQRKFAWENRLDKDILSNTYKSLINKVEKAEDVKIWSSV